MSEHELNCLIIGGPSDGARMVIDVRRPVIMLPAPVPGPAYCPERSVEQTSQLYQYTRHPFETTNGGISKRAYVYVADGINPMMALIDGYVGQSQREQAT